MSWPEYVWRPQDPNADDMGMVPFNVPMTVSNQHGIDAGLPEDWQDYDDTIETVSAWDVLSNPLYEAAAGALDIDWQEFTNNFNETIGEEDLYERPEPTNDELFDAEAYQEALDEWNNDDDAGRDTKPDPDDYRTGRDGDDYYDWGITNSSIEGDLNNMQEWLLEVVEESADKKGYSGSGPSASDWGLEGDIWEILGLTTPPKPPEELGEKYFTYKDSPSNYSKPERFENAGGFDNPWIQAGIWVGSGELKNKTMKERDWGPEGGVLPLPEPSTEPANKSDGTYSGGTQRWTRNVKEIIGKDEDVAEWAEAAGVDKLNSRKDSDQIKKVYRDSKGSIAAAVAASGAFI